MHPHKITEGLPLGNKKGLLFICDKKHGVVFLKAENFYRPTDIYRNVFGWTQSQIEKKNAEYIHPYLPSLLTQYIPIKTPENAQYNKERIPHWISENFQQLAYDIIIKNTQDGDSEEYNTCHETLNALRQKHGIKLHDIRISLQELQNHCTDREQIQNIDSLIKAIDTDFDYIGLRNGNEIILKDELSPAVYYYTQADEEVARFIDLFFSFKHAVFMMKAHPTHQQQADVSAYVNQFTTQWQELRESDMPEKLHAYFATVYKGIQTCEYHGKAISPIIFETI
jgi:hypothetical protein